MNRVKSASKNIAFGYLGILLTGPLGLILRTYFIRHLGDTLNGVNDWYISIISVLSLAELGIGTAMNYSLYAPVARGMTEKVKSYMRLYRKAYMIIGCVVAAMGILISPLLPYLVTMPEGAAGIATSDLTLYYFIFLFNTVSTYFMAYKYSLVNAEQKNYIQSNIITITRMVTILTQIAVVVLTQSFLWYLLSAALIELAQKIFANYYLNRMYPYLKDKDVAGLTKEELSLVVTKVKALILLKVGDVMRIQSGAMIITAFINVKIWGFVSNYNVVINFVAAFVNIALNNVTSSFGNLVATESKEKQYLVFRVYRFLACWIYGFVTVGFFVLLTPFVQLWLGEERLLSAMVVALILAEFYFKGDRIVLLNFKTAAGVFEADRYLPFVQGLVNIVISLSLVHSLGLAGVLLGMVISGLLANFIRPAIIYRTCFEMKAVRYFVDLLKYLLVTGTIMILCHVIGSVILKELGVVTFLLTAVMIAIVFNVVYMIIFWRSEELRYLKDIVKSRILERSKNGR
ncbi:MAG: polysaccharide biosynthesis protein [Lachnospiraceae bacterium]|jgi:hypothetical protein|nr:polysaccharide biosynthesis protein [Lachnospiraceae bacterium]